MNKLTKRLLVAGGVFLATLFPTSAQTTDVTQDFSVKSRYIGLGLNFGDNRVLQSATTFEEGNLSATLYTNSDLKEKKTNEIDAIVGLTLPISDKVEASVGYASYNLPGEAENGRRDWSALHEVSGSVNFNTFLNPSLSGCHIFDYGTYVQGSVSPDFPVRLPIIGDTELSASVALAINNKAFREGSGLSHVAYDFSMPIDLGKGVSIEPKVSHTTPLAEDIDSQSYVGATLSKTFSF